MSVPLQVHFASAAVVGLQAAHLDVFPRVLHALAQQHPVREVELALTQGRWVRLKWACTCLVSHAYVYIHIYIRHIYTRHVYTRYV